jgi:hypothetical protein
MIAHQSEKEQLQLALLKAIELTPKITRAVIHASQISSRRSLRKARLAEAIEHARELVNELVRRQTNMSWQDVTEDAP